MVVFLLAAELGFEPRHTESESAVLPLHNSAILSFRRVFNPNIQSLPLGVSSVRITLVVLNASPCSSPGNIPLCGMQSLLCYLYTIPLCFSRLNIIQHNIAFVKYFFKFFEIS